MCADKHVHNVYSNGQRRQEVERTEREKKREKQIMLNFNTVSLINTRTDKKATRIVVSIETTGLMFVH